MFSIIFFTLVVAFFAGMLLETLGDELRSFTLRLIDSVHGNSYEKSLRELHKKRQGKFS